MKELLCVITPTALNHPVFLTDRNEFTGEGGSSLVDHIQINNLNDSLFTLTNKYDVNKVVFSGNSELILPLAKDFKKQNSSIQVEVL